MLGVNQSIYIFLENNRRIYDLYLDLRSEAREEERDDTGVDPDDTGDYTEDGDTGDTEDGDTGDTGNTR